MPSNLPKQRISQIKTHWSEIFEAHDRTKTNTLVVKAQMNVMRRYGGCIYQYLYGATRDYDVADELSQEFAFRFVRGDFRNADPSKGRFRDYLKTALRNLVTDHFRDKRKNIKVSLDDNQHLAAPPADNEEDDFVELWRKELIGYAWESLQELEQQKSNYYYTVLRYRAEYPEMNSPEMAERLSKMIDMPVTSDWVRQKLRRARKKFARFLIDEVRRTIAMTDDNEIETELADLRLLKYLEH